MSAAAAGQDADDLRWMQHAIDAGALGTKAVRPNPRVGCALVRGDTLLGLGFHQRCGGPHAEIEALHAASSAFGPGAARGATAYLTLEPCNHHGRTPPCVDALLAAGIARVVVAVRDPHPVAGGGLERLRAAGVAVAVGVAAEGAARLIEGFVVGVREQRAFVRLKMAASLDGQTAAQDGSSRWLTSPLARARVHAMRAEADAVLVGSGTLLADDPRLNARGELGAPGDPPLRVVVDRRLRTPPEAAFCDPALGPSRLYTSGASADTAEAAALRQRGVEVVGIDAVHDDPASGDSAAPATGEGVLEDDTVAFLRAVLRDLRQRGQHEVLCEGGATLAAGLWRAGVVDRLELMLAPLLLGRGVGLWPGLSVGTIGEAVRLEVDAVVRLGPDLHLSARRR